MEKDNIYIKLTPLPYKKRQGHILKWTLLMYLFILLVAALNTDLNGFLLTTTFLFVLFLFDYSRRLRWVRFSIKSLDTDSFGVNLTYYDKDNLIFTTIPWNKLNVTKGSTFSKNPTKFIALKNGLEVIASFYATENFDNGKIENLYQNLKR